MQEFFSVIGFVAALIVILGGVLGILFGIRRGSVMDYLLDTGLAVSVVSLVMVVILS